MPNEVDTLFCPSRPSLGSPLLEIQEGAPQMKQRGVSEHEAGKAGQNQAGLSLVFHASRSLDFHPEGNGELLDNFKTSADLGS